MTNAHIDKVVAYYDEHAAENAPRFLTARGIFRHLPPVLSMTALSLEATSSLMDKLPLLSAAQNYLRRL